MAAAMPPKKEDPTSSPSMFDRIKQLKEVKKKRQSVLDEMDETAGIKKKG